MFADLGEYDKQLSMQYQSFYKTDNSGKSLQMKKKIEAREMRLNRRMLRIAWLEHVSNAEVLD